MRRTLLLLPLACFLLICTLFIRQLVRNEQGDDPTALTSGLLGKPLPALILPRLENPQQQIPLASIASGQPVLITLWATWCPTCREEHQYLQTLAAQGVRIIGISYKDNRQKALEWLAAFGNPYVATLLDGDGMAGLEFGVYGAPETFLIDAQGVIRHRYAGALNAAVWAREFDPLWQQTREAP